MSKVKDLLQNIVTKNASEDSYRKAVNDYISSKKEIFSDVAAAISEGNNYVFNYTPAAKSYISISYPTYQQIEDLRSEIQTTNVNQLPIMDNYDFQSHTRDEFLNTHFGFTIWDSYMLELHSTPNGDSDHEKVYDTWSFLIYIAVKYLQHKENISEILFVRSNNININDWYMKEGHTATPTEFFRQVIVSENDSFSDVEDSDISLYPVLLDATTETSPVTATLLKEQPSLDDLFNNLYMYGNKLTEITVPTSDGVITMPEYLIRCGLDLCESLNVITLSTIEQESHIIIPTVEDISTYLNAHHISNKYIAISTDRYTTIADIVLAFIMNDEDVTATPIADEDDVQITCYLVADDSEVMMTAAEIREAMLTESGLWEVLQTVNQMYDYTKDKGQNMSQIYATLMAKGLDIKGKAAEVIDLIAASDYTNIHSLMSNVFGKITNGYDTSTHQITSPVLAEYTGSACLANVNDKTKAGLQIAAEKAASLGEKIVDVGAQVVSKYYNKIKNTAADYLGVENKPYSYNKQGRDNTLDNSWTNFSFSGADVLPGWTRYYLTMPKIDANHRIVERDISNLSAESGLSNYQTDFGQAYNLADLFELDLSNSTGQVAQLLQKLIDHEAEILHMTGPACEIYLSLNNKASTLAESTFKMMVKWTPINNNSVSNIIQRAISNNSKISDMILDYFDALISSRPENLTDASTDAEKGWIERAKNTAMLAIIVPRMFGDLFDEEISSNNSAALSGALLLATLATDIIDAHTITNNANKLAWCYKNSDEISNDAYSNLEAINQARLMSGCKYDDDKKSYVPGNSIPYDFDDEICLFDLHRAVKLKYAKLLNPGSWESLVDSHSDEYSTQSILRILIAHVATSVVDNDTFVPYNWCNEITPGRYVIQTDDEEENELAIGVTALILTTIIVTTGLAVAAKKLATTINFRNLSRKAENWTWTRSDLGSKMNDKQLDMDALKQQLKQGNINKKQYDTKLAQIKEELTQISDRYKQAVKYERKTTRKVRRAAKWLLSNTMSIAFDSAKEISSISGVTSNIFAKDNNSIIDQFDGDTSIAWIKEHI